MAGSENRRELRPEPAAKLVSGHGQKIERFQGTEIA